VDSSLFGRIRCVNQASVANNDLVTIVRTYLLPEFKRHGKNPNRRRYFDNSQLPSPAYFDPWWWPIDPGNRAELWGLQPGERDELNSLCEIPRKGNSYPGFRGTLGASAGCVVLVGERPSFNASYGSAVSGVYKLVTRLAAEYNRSVEDFHVTDLIKFRGEQGGSTDDLCSHMIDLSVQCLSDEVAVLSPGMVIMTDMANDLLPFVQSKLNRSDKRLDSVTKHANRLAVSHWSRG
jgi:hypothetical protein